MNLAYKIEPEDVEEANRLIPRVVVHKIVTRIEDERKLPRGSILSPLRTFKIVEARYDAMAETYVYFKDRGRVLSLKTLMSLFDRHFTTVFYALRKRGVK